MLSQSDIHLEDVELDNAIQNNRQLNRPSEKPEKYELFFKTLNKTGSFNKAVLKCYPKECFRQRVKSLLIKMKLLRV